MLTQNRASETIYIEHCSVAQQSINSNRLFLLEAKCNFRRHDDDDDDEFCGAKFEKLMQNETDGLLCC